MADRTPPDDLIRKIMDINTVVWDDDVPPEWAKIRRHLRAVTEWADGGLIDTTTWERIHVAQVGAMSCGCPWDENGTPEHRGNCRGGAPLYTLTPREER